MQLAVARLQSLAPRLLCRRLQGSMAGQHSYPYP